MSVVMFSSRVLAVFLCLVARPQVAAQGCIYSDNGQEYSGVKDITVSGLKCARWDSNGPLDDNTLENITDVNLRDAENYCRNPNNSDSGPWCFTNDEHTTSETCGIPRCECKYTLWGKEYTGKKSWTVSGRRCQRWASDTPHSHSLHSDSRYPDGSDEAAGNFCRNPDREACGPWCFTLDPAKRWEPCPVPYCECRQDEIGVTYLGLLSQTKSGIPCQRWESQVPHSHDYAGPSNLCPNPNKDPSGPWCFTTDPSIRNESCDVPRCYFHMQTKPTFDHDPANCRLGLKYYSYAGTASETLSGRTCQRWDSQHTHSHNFTNPSRFPDASLQDAASYCRNPDESVTGPWCYTTDPHKPREVCPVRPCECKITRVGSEYAGKISRTQGGIMCQRWDSQSPHQHNMTDVEHFPDNSLSEAENFCRNPDRKEKGPWCFTSVTSHTWDFCRIPQCPEEIIPIPKPEIAITTEHVGNSSDSANNHFSGRRGASAQYNANVTTTALIASLLPLATLAFLVGCLVFLVKKKKKDRVVYISGERQPENK